MAQPPSARRLAAAMAALLAPALLAAGAATAQDVSVTCFSNRDGTVSCQRLSDNKWFTCQASVGNTSTCRSNDGEPITCIRLGGGVSQCRTGDLRARTGFDARPGFSVFGN